MSPALMGLFGLAGLSGAGAVGTRWRVGDRIRDFFENKRGFSDFGDWTDRGHNTEAVLAGVSGGDRGATSQAAGIDYQNQEQARQESLGRTNEVRDQVRNGALGQAERDVQSLPSQAISQDTFDRMASQLFDVNRLAAGSERRQAEDYAARSGGNPNVNYQQNKSISEMEVERNSAGMRDILIQQALANADYGLKRTGLMGDIGANFNQQYGAATDAVNQMSSPTPVAPLGAMADSWDLMQLAMQNENSAALSNLLMSGATGLLGAGMGQLQSGAALRASQNQGMFGGGSSLANLGAGAGLGALFGGPMGAVAGGLGGAVGMPYLGMTGAQPYNWGGMFASSGPGTYGPWATNPYNPYLGR